MNKVIGCILVGAGTAIGGGTLALPIVVAGMGFPLACITLIGIWALSWAAGLLLLETNLAFKAPHNTFATMSQATLGKAGKWFTSITFMLLLYALTSAYISGGASLIQAASQLLFNHNLPNWINATLFTIILGSIVGWSTRAVDLFNRGLFSLKAVLLLVVFIIFTPLIDVSQLIDQHEWRYLAAGLPVIFASFGGHIIIPSIAPYLDNDVAKLKKVVLFSSLLPLIVYLIWIACMLGSIPYFGENSLATIANSPTQVESLIFAINANASAPWISVVINLVSHLLLITSFLGVALSLFDFLSAKKNAIVAPRGYTALLTFIPPLLIALFYRDALIQLLGFAAIFAAFVVIIVPGLMAWRVRRIPSLHSTYRAPGGTVLIAVIIIVALGIVVTEILRILNWLPIWTG